MKRAALSFAVVAGLASSTALAADMAVKGPVAAPAPAPPVSP